MKTVSFATLALTLTGTEASGGDYSYLQNGADWPEQYPECSTSNQSPINLVSDKDYYGEIDASEDEFTKNYMNQMGVEVKWVGDTTKVTLNQMPGEEACGFTSWVAYDYYGAYNQFDAAQFHFHSGSEHTIDGERFDFEMHTVHYPAETENGFIAAAFGILFSVDNYTADLDESERSIIDNFFDSLNLESQDDPVVDMALYGDLMMMVDADNRYVYSGSVTTPPCAKSVYWNVLSTVYPISEYHLELFKQQLDRADQGKEWETSMTGNLRETGNWRETQMIDEHNVMKVTSGSDDSEMFETFDNYYEEIMGEPLDEDLKEQLSGAVSVAEGLIGDQAGASKVVMGVISTASLIAMTLY